MDHLWAPWRMAYIGGEQPPGCLFCRVLADPEHDEENLVLWREAGALVILNKYPYNPGHLMVAPEHHTGDLEALSTAETASLMSALQASVALLRRELVPAAFNVGANLGRAAGAGIPDHLHFHVVPRWNGDTNFMPVLAETKVVGEHVQETAAKLRRALAAG